jgi:hypothetical protein
LSWFVLGCRVGAVLDEDPCHVQMTAFPTPDAAESTRVRPGLLRRRRARRGTVPSPDNPVVQRSLPAFLLGRHISAALDKEPYQVA